MNGDNCPYCGNNHVDGHCRDCGDEYCDECLQGGDIPGLCPNCDGRAMTAELGDAR